MRGSVLLARRLWCQVGYLLSIVVEHVDLTSSTERVDPIINPGVVPSNHVHVGLILIDWRVKDADNPVDYSRRLQ